MAAYDTYAEEYKKLNPNATDDEIKQGYQNYGYTMGDAVGAGLSSGIYNMAGGFADFGSMFGLPTEDFADRMNKKAKEYALPDFLNKDFINNPEILADPRYWGFGVSNILPSTLSSLVGGGLAMKGASMIPQLAKYASTAGGIGGAALGTIPEVGSFYRDTGDVPESLMYWAGMTGLNYWPIQNQLGMLSGKYGKFPITRWLLGGAGEAVQEWSEEPWGAIVKGEDPIAAARAGVNVMPASFVAGLLPGLGGMGINAAQVGIDAAKKSNVNLSDMYPSVPLAPTEEVKQQFDTTQKPAAPDVYFAKTPEAPEVRMPEPGDNTPLVPKLKTEKALDEVFAKNPEPTSEELAAVPGAPKPRENKPSLDAKVKPTPYKDLKNYVEWSVREGKDGLWYKQFGNLIKDIVGEPNMSEASKVFGITSAQSTPAQNLSDTMRVMAVARMYDPVTDTESFKKELKSPGADGKKLNITNSQIDKIVEMYKTGALEGTGNPKTTDYMQGIYNNAMNLFNPYTVQDVHMARAFGFNYREAGKKGVKDTAKMSGQYANRYGDYITKKLADDLGMSPEEVQAHLWFYAKHNLAPSKDAAGTEGTADVAAKYAEKNIEAFRAVADTSRPINDNFATYKEPRFDSTVKSDPYSNVAYNDELHNVAARTNKQTGIYAAKTYGNPAGAEALIYRDDIIKADSEAEINPSEFTINDNSEQRQALRGDVIAKEYTKYTPAKGRRAVLIYGPSASGKSTIAEKYLKDVNGRLIDPDEVKPYLPEYHGGIGANKTHLESKMIADAIAKKAIDDGDNIVMPVVGKSYDKAMLQLYKLKEKGYTVDGVFVDLDIEKTYERSMRRWENTGRFVPSEYILNQVGYKPVENFIRLQKEGAFNGKTKTYSSDVERGQPFREIENLESVHTKERSLRQRQLANIARDKRRKPLTARSGQPVTPYKAYTNTLMQEGLEGEALESIERDISHIDGVEGEYAGPVNEKFQFYDDDPYADKYDKFYHDFDQEYGFSASLGFMDAHKGISVSTVYNDFHRREISSALDDVVKEMGLPEAINDAFGTIFVLEDSDYGIAAFTPPAQFESPLAKRGTLPGSIMISREYLDAITKTKDDVLRNKIRKTLRQVLTHELGHAMDITKNNKSSTWDSPLFALDSVGVQMVPDSSSPTGMRLIYKKGAIGPVMEEALKVVNSKAGEKSGLTRFLAYPLADIGHVTQKGGTIVDHEKNKEYKINESLKKERPDIHEYLVWQAQPELQRIQAELFAQIQALYKSRPETLKKYMPKAYKMAQEVNDGIEKAGTITDIYRAVRTGIRSPSATESDKRWENPFRQTVGQGFEGGVGNNDPNTGVFRSQTTGFDDTFGQAADKERPEVQSEFDRVRERVGQVGGEQTAFERKRGVIPNEVAKSLAAALGTTEEHIQRLSEREKGDIDNVEELVGNANAIRDTWDKGLPLFKELAEKRKNGTISQKDIAEAGEILTRMAAIGSQYFGVRGEVGRALQIFRTTQDAVEKAEYMIRSLKGVNSEEDLLDAVEALSTVEEPGKAANAARELYKLKASDYFMEWYYMTLLSGVPTHVVNLVSTGIMGAVGEFDNIVASAIGGLMGDEDRITMSEIAARMKAVGKGVMYGANMFSNVMRNFEKEDFTEFGNQKIDRPQKRAIPGIAGKAIRLPMRALSAEDAFWKGTFYTMGLAQEAERISNLTGQSVEDLLNNPTKEMRDNAWKQAEQATFTERGGEITKALQRFRKAHPIFNIVFPFVQTPGNIIKTAVRHSLAAPMMKEVREDIRAGGRRKHLAYARIATGTMIMSAAVMMVLQGVMTGQPPEDPQKRRYWYAQGNQPYSVKIGDQWVSFSRLEPFGTLLGTAADMVSIARRMNADEAEEAWSVVIASVFNNLTSKTYLRGLSDLITMIQDPERYSERYFQRFLSTLAVPTGVAYMAKAQDDRRRMINSLPDAIKARLPYLRQSLPERLDFAGRPIMETGSSAYRMLSPAYLSDVTTDPVSAELDKYDVRFPVIGKRFRGVELTPDQRNELIEFTGKPAYKAIEKLIKSAAYKRMPDYAKKYVLQKIIDRIRNTSRKVWSIKNPDILREALALQYNRRYGNI